MKSEQQQKIAKSICELTGRQSKDSDARKEIEIQYSKMKHQTDRSCE